MTSVVGAQHFAPSSQILLAYSGGIDSTVLLHQLAQAYPSENLRAIHINHGLYPEADAWQQHCEKTCANLNIPLMSIKLDSQPQAGESIEAWARAQRYAIFQDQLKENEILITAQHADDQAETVLLQLIRGAGPKGLSAMPDEKPFGKGKLIRPLLNTPKAEIIQYAKEHKLTWVHDHSNSNIQFDRNFLREKIIPELKSRWPSLDDTFSRSARYCAEQTELVQCLLNPLYTVCAGSREGTLSIHALSKQPEIIQRALVRHWLADKQLPMPGHKKFDKIFEDLIPARPDAQPEIIWGEVCLRRYRDDLYALKLHEINPSQTGTKKTFQRDGIPPWERKYTEKL